MSEPKKQLRPLITSIKKTEYASLEEKFQNEVLRPILKLQHEFIISCFEHFLILNKVQFNELSSIQKADVIQKLFKTDLRLKMELRSLIIGLFTYEEYKAYLIHSSRLNKRIYSMIQKRVESVYLNN
jgi:hypothetical protein